MSELNAAVVGAGRISSLRHLPNLRDSDRYSLDAIVDLDDTRLERAASDYGVPRTYATVSSLLADLEGDLDCAFVSTPPETHARILEAFSSKDVDIFLEKPIASTPWSVERAVEAAKDVDGIVTLGYQRRSDRAIDIVAERLDDGLSPITVSARTIDTDVRKALSGRSEIDGAFGEPEPPAEEERRRMKRELNIEDESDVISYYFKTSQICHEVNLLRALFGDVESVAHAETFDTTFLEARLVHDSGVRSTITAGVTERNWFEQSLVIDGTTAKVDVTFESPWLRDSETELRIENTTSGWRSEAVEGSFTGSFRREIEEFADCVESGTEPEITVAEAARDVEVIQRIFESI